MKNPQRIRRPRADRATCAHCGRRRARRFIEWHPGIEAWQCSCFDCCDGTRLARLVRTDRGRARVLATYLNCKCKRRPKKKTGRD